MKRNTIKVAAGFALLLWEGALSYAERIPAGGYLKNPYLSCTSMISKDDKKMGEKQISGSLNSQTPFAAELPGGFTFKAAIADQKLRLTLTVKGATAQSSQSIDAEAEEPGQRPEYTATGNQAELTLGTAATGAALVKCSLSSWPR